MFISLGPCYFVILNAPSCILMSDVTKRYCAELQNLRTNEILNNLMLIDKTHLFVNNFSLLLCSWRKRLFFLSLYKYTRFSKFKAIQWINQFFKNNFQYRRNCFFKGKCLSVELPNAAWEAAGSLLMYLMLWNGTNVANNF